MIFFKYGPKNFPFLSRIFDLFSHLAQNNLSLANFSHFCTDFIHSLEKVPSMFMSGFIRTFYHAVGLQIFIPHRYAMINLSCQYNTDIQTILSSFSFPGTPYLRVPIQKCPDFTTAEIVIHCTLKYVLFCPTLVLLLCGIALQKSHCHFACRG